MLASLTCSPNLGPTRRASDLSLAEPDRPLSPESSDLRGQAVGTLLPAMPLTQSPAPKKPKLSLQTALPSFTPSHERQPALGVPLESASPIARNTVGNTLESPPPTPSSAIKPSLDFSCCPATSLTASAARVGHVSPFSQVAPYALPIGAHSILRNSPLPRRHIAATPSRPHKRMFIPTKQVHIAERPPELIPTPVFDHADEECEDGASTTEAREERQAAIEAEHGHSSMAGRRFRRSREWIWRPMPEEASGPTGKLG